jgi:hypothetical protein
VPLMIVDTDLTPQDHYDVLDGYLTDLLEAAGVDVGGEEVLACLISYNRYLKIALGLPVEVAS